MWLDTFILNSCPTQGPVEGWDAMKPIYRRSVNSKDTGRPHLTHHQRWMKWNETKWMRWVRRNVEIKFVVGENGKITRKPTQTQFCPPRNPHGVIETRTRDPSGKRRASNRLRHGAASHFFTALFLVEWQSSPEDLHKQIIKFKIFLLFKKTKHSSLWRYH